jgi:hypothetical protein
MALHPPGDIANINNLSATQLHADIQDLENRMAGRRREQGVRHNRGFKESIRDSI